MREISLLHGQVYETNIPSYTEQGHGFEKIILWCTNRSGRDEQGQKNQLIGEEKEAASFLERLLECEPSRRITAEEALRHPFIARAGEEDEGDEEMVDLVSS